MKKSICAIITLLAFITTGVAMANSTAKIMRKSANEPYNVTVNNQSTVDNIVTSENAANAGFPASVSPSTLNTTGVGFGYVAQPQKVDHQRVRYNAAGKNTGCDFYFDTTRITNTNMYETTVTAVPLNLMSSCNVAGSSTSGSDGAFHLVVTP